VVWLSVTVGRFEPPAMQVSITDGRRQILFDRPSDMVRWFLDHPGDAAAVDRYVWTTQQIAGGG
jgi:hypothetical protein